MLKERAVQELRAELEETQQRILEKGLSEEGARLALSAVVGGLAAIDVILDEN